MLLIRAFPLSLAITWRFLIALPLWAILYILITVFATLGGLFIVSIAISIPLIGALVAMFFSLLGLALTFMVVAHPYLIATRIGLNVLGIKTEPSEKRLLVAAAGYGLIERILNFLVVAVITSISVALFREGALTLQFSDFSPIIDPIANLSAAISSGRITVLAAITGSAVLALRAAMLPVLANVAAGRDPRGSSYTPAHGFGQGFTLLFPLLVLIIAISALIVPFVSNAADYIGLSNVLTTQLSNIVLSSISEDGFGTFTPMDAVQIALTILIAIWLFCLQCAGAALNYESRSVESPQEKEAIIAAQQAQSQEIGDLLRSRMQNNTR